MKKIILMCTALLVSSIVVAGAPKKEDKKNADLSKSEMVWTGKKITGSHTGMIKLLSGFFNFEKDKIKGGEFEIDMKSITCSDLTDSTSNATLVGHLKADDFFGVEKFPTAKITIKEAKYGKKGAIEFTGDLTIKGITKPITFNATEEVVGNEIIYKSTISVNRTIYGIHYGSASFFNVGDKAINDEFTIEAKIVVAKK